MNQVIWSPVAQDAYLATLAFLMKEYSLDVAVEFDAKVDKLIQRLQQFKHFCPPSRLHRRLRRCVINKQASLIYRIKGEVIEIVSFFDNRSNHLF